MELFRTCVAAIPKCIPDGMTKSELVELMSRLTVHVDEELRHLAYTALQTLIVDFPEYRQDIIDGVIDYVLKDVQVFLGYFGNFGGTLGTYFGVHWVIFGVLWA